MSGFPSQEVRAAYEHARRLYEQGRKQEAAMSCDAQLARWPGVASILHLRASIALEAGEMETAERLLRTAATNSPRDPSIHCALGSVLRRLKKTPEAVRALRQAIHFDGTNVDALNLLGLCLLDLGSSGEAGKVLAGAAALGPLRAETHHNLGLVLKRQGRLEEALSSFQRAMELDPALMPSNYACATTLLELGRATEAEAAFLTCLRLQAKWPAATVGLSLALEAQGREAEAEALLNESTSADPLFAPNLGNLLGRQGKFTEALAIFDRLLSTGAASAPILHNRANVLARMGRSEEAEQGFRRAIKVNPQYSDAHFGLSHCLLSRGDSTEGWREFAWRPIDPRHGTGMVRVTDPVVASRLRVERAVVLLEEQGIGDMLFFLRWAKPLVEQGWRFQVRCSRRLASILRRIGIFEAVGEDIPQSGWLAIPVGDLPLLGHELGVDPFPRSLRLAPLAEQVESARQALAAAGPGPYIGVTWRAGSRARALRTENLGKEVDIGQLLEGLAWEGTIIALQRGVTSEEIDALHNRGYQVVDFSAWSNDLEATLGLLSVLEDYSGVSNTNVHLLALLGKTARVVVPDPPEWRWAGSGESRWFPGFSIVRQGPEEPWPKALPPPGTG